MQSTIKFVTLTTPIGLATKPETQCLSMRPNFALPKHLRRLKTSVASNDSSPTTVDYSSMSSSVFPAEACDTVGGEACEVDMYPEVKLESSPEKPTTVSEQVDREYLQYDDKKTVFPGEACDDLGGEFCEPDYQAGVY